MTKSIAGVCRLSVSFALAVCGLMAVPSGAYAQGEITGVVGGMVGGDLNNVLAGNASIKGAFDNGPVYGVRLGAIGGFFGVEGSFVMSPTGLSLSLPNRAAGANASVYYLEGNVLFIPIPGPISPFVTAGVGLHSYKLDLEAGNVTAPQDEFQKFGWNFGGGLKINIKALTLRADIRDHITTIGPDDLDLVSIASELGITDEETVHNVEISAGIGIRF